MRQFDTSIKKLIKEKNEYNKTHAQEAFFISDWDVSIDIKPYGLLIDNNLYDKCTNINSYFYWTDEQGYSSYFSDYYKKKFHQSVDSEMFLIGNNGTSSIMLALIALSELSIKRILVFTPIYFSTLNLLEMLDFQIYRYDLIIENNFQIDYTNLAYYIKKNNIEALFITDPIFGTGIEYEIETYKSLSKIIKKYNLYTVIDYVYGGMLWNETDFVFNKKTFDIINNIPNLIFIESIVKRLFLNGIKFSLVFSTPLIIKKIKRLSIYTTGSMCFNQLELYKKIYNYKYSESINGIISDNIHRAQNTYKMIMSILMGKNCVLSKCNSSFFLLIGIPKDSDEKDMDIATKILKQTGILTIPHSRYLMQSNEYYYFRVNLLLNNELLMNLLPKIIPLV